MLSCSNKSEKYSSGPVAWVFTHGTEIPAGALVCGEDIDGSPLHVCRTFNQGGIRELCSVLASLS